MASIDIFKGSAFSMISLTGAINKVDYKPQLLGSLGIFDPMPVRETRAQNRIRANHGESWLH